MKPPVIFIYPCPECGSEKEGDWWFVGTKLCRCKLRFLLEVRCRVCGYRHVSVEDPYDMDDFLDMFRVKKEPKRLMEAKT